MVILAYKSFCKMVFAQLSSAITARIRAVIVCFRSVLVYLVYHIILAVLLTRAVTRPSGRSALYASWMVALLLTAKGWVGLVLWCWVNPRLFDTSPLPETKQDMQLSEALLSDLKRTLIAGLRQSAKPQAPGQELAHVDVNSKGDRLFRRDLLHCCEEGLKSYHFKDFIFMIFTNKLPDNVDRASDTPPSAHGAGASQSPLIRRGSLLQTVTGGLRGSVNRDSFADEEDSAHSTGPRFFQTSHTMVEYRFSAFHRVREACGISKDDFESTWGDHAKDLNLKINEGGRSQAFFILSKNKRFFLKSCTKGEMEILKKEVGEDYADFFEQNPNSFLCRIFGAFKLTIYEQK